MSQGFFPKHLASDPVPPGPYPWHFTECWGYLDHITVWLSIIKNAWVGSGQTSHQPAGYQSAFTAMRPGPRHPQKSAMYRLWCHTDLQLECGVATYCVILGKSVDLSEPQVPHLSYERNKSFSFKDSQHAFCSARLAAWWVVTFPTGTRGVRGTEVTQRHRLKTIPEAQKWAASSSPVLSLPHLLNILSKTHPTTHQRDTGYAPWGVFTLHTQRVGLISRQHVLAFWHHQTEFLYFVAELWVCLIKCLLDM